MRVAFAVSKLSELLILEIVKQFRHNWIDVYTNNYNLVESVESLGVECIYLPPIRESNKVVRDKLFYDQFMPGMLDGIDLDIFPIWKSLSLDRLKFWNDTSYSKYDIPHYDVCYSSLDIMSVFPWVIPADKRIGIKIDSVRTRTMVDFLNCGYLDEAILSHDDELALTDIAISAGLPRLVKPRLNNESFRLNHAQGNKIVGVIFDKQNDWQYREFVKYLSNNPNYNNYFMAFAPDERSKQLYWAVGGMMELQPLAMLKNCDLVVDFSFHEEVYNNCLGEYIVLDYNNINNAKMVSAGLENVRVEYESSNLFR